jgi:hypothetical protein
MSAAITSVPPCLSGSKSMGASFERPQSSLENLAARRRSEGTVPCNCAKDNKRSYTIAERSVLPRP